MGAVYSVESAVMTIGLLLAGGFILGFTLFLYFQYTDKVTCDGYGKKPQDEAKCNKMTRYTRYTEFGLAAFGGIMVAVAVVLIFLNYVKAGI